MGDYLLVSRPPDDAAAFSASSGIADAAAKAGYSVTALNAHAWLAVRGPSPPGQTTVGGWLLIGDVYDRRAPRLASLDPTTPWAYERNLLARVWGRYVGILFGRSDQPTALLRDPSGALECVTWTQDELLFVCSAADPWLMRRLHPNWSINCERLHQAAHSLIAPTGALILDGPTALEPGVVQPLPLPQPPEVLWSPADHARRSLETPPSQDAAQRALRDAVDEAVEGLSRPAGPLAAEVSGGLDSSIVAASLQAQRPDAVALWLNAFGSTPESDERQFATLLAEHLGFDVTCIPHHAATLTTAEFEAFAGGFRPGLNALDHAQDLRWLSEIREAGAVALMTGKGGDSVLFQAANASVFTDRWITEGWRALWHADTAELAAANEISVWTMMASSRAFRGPDLRQFVRAHPMLADASEPPAPHPWLRNLETLGPAKAFHIAGVADSVSNYGPSALNRNIDVRHPLCSQPVVETCLALPAWLLATGARDRGLARAAFADRLPGAIATRRTKGEMTRIYGRLIAASLGQLRPWLADGRLAALGVIDRKAALSELTPEVLIWRGQHAAIFTLAALEAWVRCWESWLEPAR